jgi:natural product biosynthesis luciferase-like monooxygenase protein/non-ribosomal peptide synthase protein (TIGR01720 family)
LSRKIRRIQALEALGSEVLLLTADVTDEGQVRAALADARRRFGEINGVIHAAGVPGGGIIQLKTRAAAAAVLAPKVMGTRLLDRALGDADLDFFALCSSRSSILGGFGQIDYSAANAFLDAFAHYNTMRRGTFTVSINWDAWQGVGMLVDAAAQYGVGKETPQHVISQTGHPLLDRQIAETDGQEIYVTEVSPSTHWVLDDHRIVGAAIMPGTAYLEMARAALEKHPRKNAVVEIRDAFFLAPLGMRDDETSEVRTVLEKDGDDFEYRILSKPPSGGGAVAEWQQYSIGRIGYVEAGDQRRFDIDAIRERCSRREVVITDELEIDPDLGPRWQSLRQVFIGDNELLAALELPVEFESDFRQFRLHPALLDRATGTAKHYLTTGGHYLPMSYKRLRIKGDLPRKIYTYIKYRDDLSDSKETITFDIIVMDEHGVECIDIEGFSQKRVNDTAEPLRTLGQTKSHNVEHADIAQNGDGGYRKSLDEGITPLEGVDAFRRILAARPAPQVIVSTKDLQASIRRARTLTQSRVAEEVEKLEVSRPAHARPDMASAYAAPRNETEATLCEILQTMLGIQQIGINDNFFDLGGDSVLGIQIIAKANRAGIQLTPQQIFQHQTVAEMALAAGRTQASKAEQGIVTGPVPLTPAQHRLFEREHTAPERRGRATLLEMRETIDAAMMEKAVASIYEHHDALRLRFTRGDDGWQQENAGLEESAPFSQFDISMLDGAAQQSAIGKTTDELEARLRLTEGPLALFASFHLGEGKPDRLLIIVHDLAFDDASWQVLLEDLEMAYRQLSSHKAVSLPQKTTSFKHWAERLVTRAESESVKSELGFWLNPGAGATSRLPANEPGGADLEGSARSILIKLGDEEAQSLIREMPKVYNTRITDVLLTALVRAVSRQTGSRSLLLEMEVNGREAMLEGVSPSRTIGSLTECFPVSLSLEENSGPVESLSSIKEQLRAVPNWGLDFGLLCYLAGDAETKARLRALPSPEIFFRYLSKPAKVPTDSTLFTGDAGARGGLGRGDATRGHFVEVEAVETGGELCITLNYSENVHPRETIEQLAEDFLTELRVLIAHRVSPGTVGFTPSDFPLAGLDEDKLSKLSSLIEDSDEDEEAGAAIAEVEEALRQNPDVSEAVVVAQGGGADEGLVAYVTLDGTQGNGSKRAKALDFSLFYFADADAGNNADKYRLYLEGAKFADRHGFSAVWTPERHFHENGGLYPSPSVLSAALATITENVRLRAGSVVLPLHNPIKVAEEWAIIDNLSKGRVDISITSGWIPNDFAFFPERFANKREEMFRLLEEVRTLWQGRTIKTRDGAGNMVDLKVYPKPVQQELPIWLTCSGDPQMFIKAGEMGVNVLTALLTQSIEETAAKIALYREARAKHGHDPDAGHVTLMMHTFVGDNLEDVVGKVRGPLCEYLKSHVGLVKTMVKSLDLSVDINSEELLDYLVEFAFERYYQTASLIGTPEKCLQTIGRLKEIGVDEVACFIDFGVDAETVLDGLRHLDALKNMSDRASGPRARSRTHGPQLTSDSLRRFAAERLPAHMVPMDVVVLDALPRTQDGEIDRASLPTPTVAHAE